MAHLSLSGDADLDVHPHGALPSLFSRAFHSRPVQPSPSDLLEQTTILNRLLPQQHPLLIHRTDYHIHHATPQTAGGGGPSSLQTSTTSSTAGATTSTSRGNESDPQQPESAMQQLLTNISAATGSSELLGFGVGGATSDAQRSRTPQGGAGSGVSDGSSGGSGNPPQPIDDGLESTTIPSTFSRWEEESAAIDGHMPHMVMRVLREDILKHWVEVFEKENAPKEDQNKSSTSATVSGTSAMIESGSSTSSAVGATASAEGLQGESSIGDGASVSAQHQGETTPGTITVPNPSDEATPSSHSPRDQSSVVDQLRSGLRQVADALAQTVAVVRNTREQFLQSREAAISTGAVAGDNEGTSMDTSGTAVSLREEEREEEGATEEVRERNRGEAMELQNALVAEATGEELTTHMEEGSVSEATGLAPPPAPQEELQPSRSPAPSPSECSLYLQVLYVQSDISYSLTTYRKKRVSIKHANALFLNVCLKVPARNY